MVRSLLLSFCTSVNSIVFLFLLISIAVSFYHTDFPSFLPAGYEQEDTEGNRQNCGNPASNL